MKRLFINFARIGDLVMASPVLRQFAENAELHILCRGFGAPLLADQSYISGVHILRHPNLGRKGIRAILFGKERSSLGKKLQTFGFDEVIIHESERPHIRKWISRFFPHAHVRELTASSPDGLHYTELHHLQLKTLGLSEKDILSQDPSLEITDQKKQAAHTLLAPLRENGPRLISLQIGTQRTDAARFGKRTRPNLKSPPLHIWTGLCKRLLHENMCDGLLVHGSPQEASVIAPLIAAMPPEDQHRIYDMTSSVPLDLLPAVLAESYALISADTGPAHIATAVGCPLLVFFGPSDPNYYRMAGSGHVVVIQQADLCPPCMADERYKTCQNNICLSTLTDTYVWQAWTDLASKIHE